MRVAETGILAYVGAVWCGYDRPITGGEDKVSIFPDTFPDYIAKGTHLYVGEEDSKDFSSWFVLDPQSQGDKGLANSIHGKGPVMRVKPDGLFRSNDPLIPVKVFPVLVDGWGDRTNAWTVANYIPLLK